jgi:hypothetical protein
VLKILLIALLVFVLIRMIVQGLSSYYAGYYEAGFKESERKKEGEVTIDKNTKHTKKIGKDDGQYVDYEEIK